MRLFKILFSLLTAALLVSAATDNLTGVVAWDKYSLLINGERVFLFSGEFHYQRMPVPELWFDIFQKFKANGLNAVSIYFFWSYHSASKGVFDFTTSGKDVQRVLDMAKEAGLYVIARPGPYCNAETNAGGFALWTSDGSGGSYRTSNETYHQAWLPWVAEIGSILAKNQITNGGPVILHQIENELQETSHVATNTLVLYMEQIEAAFRDAGMIVPSTHNEKGMRSESWSTDYQNVGGAVNIYGLDSYPGGLSCKNINSGFNIVRTFYQWFQNYSFTQPEYIPEYEAGYFQPWGGYFYDQCLAEHDPAFADVYYKTVIGQRVTLLSLYMAFGGTNWGQSAAPVVYTSYDYSAPLRETREVLAKFKQTKLIALFTRVSKDLLKTAMESNGTGNAVDNTAIYTWVLRNPDTKAGFYLAEHATSSSRAITNFSITVNTTSGPVTIPNMQLNGRQSRFVVTDYTFGDETLLYSSAEVLTYGIFGVPVIVFYLKVGQVGEFAFKSGSAKKFKAYGVETGFVAKSNGNITKYTYTQGNGMTVVQFSNRPVVYLLDLDTAYSFYAPPTVSNPEVTPDKQIFVLGPYIVRNASTSNGVVRVSGDNANQTTIEIYVGDDRIKAIEWNGKPLTTKTTAYGSLVASIPGVASRKVELPPLTQWKMADSLPEIARNYDDSKWTVCNKTTTLGSVKPLTLPVLFSSDYEYYTGIKIYRGYFDSQSATGANITVQGGYASGWSAWLNGNLVGGSPGNASLSATWKILSFSNATMYAKGNVLTVLADYNGHDETSVGPTGAENPRGILGAVLYESGNSAPNFTQWKIQGNAGGSKNIDAVRGPMNEGGLYGERLGWHLPGFDTSQWKSGNPTDGLTKSGVTWYQTTFQLDIDDDLDVPIGIELGASTTVPARVQIFVNGYQYGKFLPHIGPQTKFPVPPGIINNRGSNTLAISLWAQTDAGAKLDTVSLISYGKYETDFGFSRDWSYLQPGWSRDRLQYA
ncbi:glycoside hydrolase family 35 protein [Glonium stellatum]|uniref:beta-galactosidase n=1 Tax=Glonium stellatum TaxID=574774 RepID=A0A8E2FDI0_9PEZI|nr:glycoside hydrolase family 35 protein [Glonium stellatum]